MKTRRAGASPRRALDILLPVAALLVWVLLLSFASQAGAFMEVTGVRYDEEQGVSPAQLVREQRYAIEDGREDLPTQTAWKEQANQMMTDESGDRSAPVNLLTCFGSGDDLYPAPFLFGSMPVRGDVDGIALSKAAANALWGGTGAAGQTVRLNGKTYALRGVFEADTALAVVQDREDSEELYPNLLVRGERIGGGGTALDLPFLSWLLSTLAGLPGILLMAAILFRLIGRGWKLRYSPLLLSQYVLPALAMGVLALLAAGFPWDIPAKMIPTRFSNLDFWGKLAEEVGSGVVGVVTHSMTVRDLALWTPVLFCLILLPIACALTLAASSRARAASLNALLAGGMISMGLTFGLALAFDVNLSYSVLALPVLWLAVDLALFTHDKLLKPKRERRSDNVEAPYQAALGDTGE